MRKKPSFLILTLLFTLILAQVTDASPGIEELKQLIGERERQIEEIEEEIGEFQRRVSEKTAEANTLKNEIKRLETLVAKLNAEIRLTQGKINASELRLEKLALEISSKNAGILKQKAGLKAILKSVNEIESASLVEILFSHDALSDFFGNLEYVSSLERAVQKELRTLKTLRKELEAKEGEEEETKTALEDFREELEDRRAIQSSAKRNKDELLRLTKNQEVEFQRLLSERERQREEMQKEIQEIEDELRKLIDPSRLPAPRKGLLAWPIEGAVLTQSFGNTPDSQILYNGEPHNGIDIRAPLGTPVRAAEKGVVVETGDTDAFPRCLSYGKWVLVRHENNLSTLYAHLSLIKVKKGESAERGGLLGYSGATGYATGPHLHFTVYDANTVRFEASKRLTSTCRLLPFGGYLNPLAYL